MSDFCYFNSKKPTLSLTVTLDSTNINQCTRETWRTRKDDNFRRIGSLQVMAQDKVSPGVNPCFARKQVSQETRQNRTKRLFSRDKRDTRTRVNDRDSRWGSDYLSPSPGTTGRRNRMEWRKLVTRQEIGDKEESWWWEQERKREQKQMMRMTI